MEPSGPRLGEHTAEVLAELGLTAELDRLGEEGGGAAMSAKEDLLFEVRDGSASSPSTDPRRETPSPSRCTSALPRFARCPPRNTAAHVIVLTGAGDQAFASGPTSPVPRF